MKGITDSPGNIDAIRALVGDMKHEPLCYNPFAEAKYKMLGTSYLYNQFKQN